MSFVNFRVASGVGGNGRRLGGKGGVWEETVAGWEEGGNGLFLGEDSPVSGRNGEEMDFFVGGSPMSVALVAVRPLAVSLAAQCDQWGVRFTHWHGNH